MTFDEVEDCFPDGMYDDGRGGIIVSAQWLHDFARAVARRQEAENTALQARIDALMQEYCPEEITPEQWANIEANTRAVDGGPEITVTGRDQS